MSKYSITLTVCEGKKLGFTIDLGKLHNVSLGQGQEAVAELAMEKASQEGHWVILQVRSRVHYVAPYIHAFYQLQIYSHIHDNVLCSVHVLEHSPGCKVARKSGEASGTML